MTSDAARRARDVDAFASLTNTHARGAKRALMAHEWDLHLALDAHYAMGDKSARVRRGTSTSERDDADESRTRDADVEALMSIVREHERAKRENAQKGQACDGYVKSIACAEEAAVETAEAFARWAREARERVESRGTWRDDAFAAACSSVDGRVGARGEEKDVPRCACGVAATVKRVGKDGKNNGRLFYACAKGNGARWGARGGEDVGERCDFFAWAADRNLQHTEQAMRLRWERFAPPRFKFARRVSAADIRQGSVGDCWFLSSLAVVAEREDLLNSVIGVSRELASIMERIGSYFIRFFLGGRWRAIVVDDLLPVKDAKVTKLNQLDEQTPAFSRASNNQIWVSITEKAYAKAHGSYAAISGGYIAEGLHDLTGAATEMISFSADDFDSEEMWIRLLSYSSCGFRMGAATSFSGEGIVGGHAYSILEIVELHDVKKGVQTKLTDVFAGTAARTIKAETETLRLVKLRNPWGKREWRGEFSSKSMAWTKRLGDTLSRTRADDGTFWMSYQDLLLHFTSIDVCKSPIGWHALNMETILSANDAASPQFIVKTDDDEKSAHSHVLLLQHTTRGRVGQWHTDLSLFVSSRPDAKTPWTPRGAIFGAREREACQGEMILDSGTEYLFTVVSFAGAGAHDTPITLRLCAANAIKGKPVRFDVANEAQNIHIAAHIPTAMSVSGGEKANVHRERIEICGGFISVVQFGGASRWAGLIFVFVQADFDRASPLRVKLAYRFKDDAVCYLCERDTVVCPGKSRLALATSAVGPNSPHAFEMTYECIDCTCANALDAFDPDCIIVHDDVVARALPKSPRLPPRRIATLFKETDAAFWCSSAAVGLRRHRKNGAFHA